MKVIRNIILELDSEIICFDYECRSIAATCCMAVWYCYGDGQGDLLTRAGNREDAQ